MATVTFDTYKAIKLLRERGFKKEQAEGLIEVTQEIDVSGITTKEDLANLKVELMRFMFLLSMGIIGITVSLTVTLIKLL